MREARDAPREEGELPLWADAGCAALWCLVLLALAVVPDQKILRYKLLALEAGVGALLAAVFAGWLAAPKPAWIRTPLDIPVALYAAGGLLFYALSPERGASALELTRILFSAAVFFAASQTIPRLRRPELVCVFWSATAALLGVYALLQTRGGIWIIDVPQLERPIATFGNPIFLAGYLAASVAVSLGLAARASGGLRGFLSVCAALAAAGLLTTQTRAGVAGLGAAAALAALVLMPARRRWWAFGALAVLLALAAWWFRGRQWTHGLIWKDTIALWLSHPWLGCGLGRFHIEFPAHASDALRALWPQQKVIVNFAHNEYLQVLAETGIVGFALFVNIVAAAVIWILRTSRDRREDLLRAAGPAFAAVALLGQNVFSPDLRFGVSSFVVFFCLAAATAGRPGARSPIPEFPGRFACAGLAAILLALWGRMAVQPILAQRRLVRQPGFHIKPSDALSQALRDLEAKLAADPKNADIAENLAYAYAKQKSWPRAVSRFKLAAELAPDRPGPLNNLGNISYMLGDREGAIVYWKRSLEVDPAQLDANINLGKTLYELGRLKEASAHIQEVLKRHPRNEKAQILLKKMIE